MAIETNILLQAGTNELEVVEFIIRYNDDQGNIVTQSYGINVAKVREIIMMPELTKLPNLPSSIYGVFNLRNTIIPALDLKKYLYNIENINPTRKMIIAEFNSISSGFIVDDVNQIHRVSWADIVSPDSLQEIDSENSSIVGIIKYEDRNILMLDVEKICVDIDPSIALDKSSFHMEFDTKPIAITAEDSTTLRKMISERLTKAGFEILSFSDGQQAWDKLEEIKKRVAAGEELSKLVNVVITDIEMPKMNGYTLTKLIKTDNILSKLPVAIFSSIISGDTFQRGQSVGADVQLSKPQIGELISVLNALLHQAS